MQKMKVPESAIRSQMAADGVTAAHINAFFFFSSKDSDDTTPPPPAPVVPNPPAPAAPPVESPESSSENPSEDKFAKYGKMKRMNLPEGAIRGRMAIDGLSPQDIEAFFSGGGGEEVSNPPVVKIPPPAPIAPPVPPPIPKPPAPVPVIAPPAPVIEVTSGSSVESGLVDEKYLKYVKMQKMNLPEGAIRGRMVIDGLSSADIEAFFSGKITAPIVNPPKPPVSAPVQEDTKLNLETQSDDSSLKSPMDAYVEAASKESPRVRVGPPDLLSLATPAPAFGEQLKAARASKTVASSVIEEIQKSTLLSEPAPDRFGKYSRMREVGASDTAVRLEMDVDRLSMESVKAFFGDDLPLLPVPAKLQSAPGLSELVRSHNALNMATAGPVVDPMLPSEEKLNKFSHMKKLADDVIRKNMLSAGLSDEDIDKFFEKSGPPDEGEEVITKGGDNKTEASKPEESGDNGASIRRKSILSAAQAAAKDAAKQLAESARDTQTKSRRINESPRPDDQSIKNKPLSQDQDPQQKSVVESSEVSVDKKLITPLNSVSQPTTHSEIFLSSGRASVESYRPSIDGSLRQSSSAVSKLFPAASPTPVRVNEEVHGASDSTAPTSLSSSISSSSGNAISLTPNKINVTSTAVQTSTSASANANTNEGLFSKYASLLRMGFPREAVHERMWSDGVSQKEVEEFFWNFYNPAPASASTSVDPSNKKQVVGETQSLKKPAVKMNQGILNNMPRPRPASDSVRPRFHISNEKNEAFFASMVEVSHILVYL
jgi:hypothetical protein